MNSKNEPKFTFLPLANVHPATFDDDDMESLNYLYNASSDSQFRISIFTAIIQFAVQAQQGKELSGIFDVIDGLFQQCSPDHAQQRAIFLSLAQLSDSVVVQSDYYLKYIQSFDHTPGDISSSQDQIEKIILSFVRDPIYMLMESIFISAAAKSLEINQPILYQLVSILTNGLLSDYETFLSQHKAFLDQHTIEEDMLLRKMRILTIVGLASKQECLSYNLISESIRIPISDVEFWVIEAICSGLLQAEIDQVNQTVWINYAPQRIFSLPQWQSLRKNLNDWKENIDSMIKVVQTARTQTHRGDQLKALHQGFQVNSN